MSTEKRVNCNSIPPAIFLSLSLQVLTLFRRFGDYDKLNKNLVKQKQK